MVLYNHPEWNVGPDAITDSDSYSTLQGIVKSTSTFLLLIPNFVQEVTQNARRVPQEVMRMLIGSHRLLNLCGTHL